MRSTLKALLVILAFMATALVSEAQDQKELVTILSTKRYIFHFKVDASLVGGTVSIFDGSYKLVKTEGIPGKKNIIDFFDLPAGVYTIKIKKDDKLVVIQYENFE